MKHRPAPFPDMNPIEKLWRKITAHWRLAKARISRTPHAAIRKAFDFVTPEDAKF